LSVVFIFPGVYIAINVFFIRYARAGGYAQYKEFLFPAAGLTPREDEVARILGEGASYKKVADTLCISLSMVQTHVKSIYRKTGINSKYTLINCCKNMLEN